MKMPLPLTPQYFKKLDNAFDAWTENKPAVNSASYLNLCDQFDVEPSDLEDIIIEDDVGEGTVRKLFSF
tara:strand:+ start:20250 stop:20456 length:207 start_codon:yes stop_codon:yes gene_type:complete